MNHQCADVSGSHTSYLVMQYTCSIALCPDLSNPANGMVTITGNSAGDTGSYVCDPGYELIGPMTLTCTDDGTWSDEPPVCRRKWFTFITSPYLVL